MSYYYFDRNSTGQYFSSFIVGNSLMYTRCYEVVGKLKLYNEEDG